MTVPKKHTDWTEEVYQRSKLHKKKYNAPIDRTTVEVIEDYRRRQRAGKAGPKWDEWSEFEVRLKDGSPVTVLYDPKTWTHGPDWHVEHFQFRGPLTSTGYRSHFDHNTKENRKKGETVVQYATRIAHMVAAEYAEKERSDKVVEARKKASAKRKREMDDTPLFAMMGDS